MVRRGAMLSICLGLEFAKVPLGLLGPYTRLHTHLYTRL